LRSTVGREAAVPRKRRVSDMGRWTWDGNIVRPIVVPAWHLRAGPGYEGLVQNDRVAGKWGGILASGGAAGYISKGGDWGRDRGLVGRIAPRSAPLAAGVAAGADESGPRARG
jgi:hypothetical protein